MPMLKNFDKNALVAFIRYHLTPRPKWLLCTLAAFVCVNLFWMLAEQWIFVFRPYLNYDYIIPITLASVTVWGAFACFVLIYFQEVFINHSLVFHFHDLAGFFKAGAFAGELNFIHFITITDAALFISFCALAYLVARFLKGRTNFIVAFTVVLLAFAADQLNGSSYFFKSDNQFVTRNIGGSSTLKIRHSFLEHNQSGIVVAPLPREEVVLDAKMLMSWVSQNPGHSVLMVIIESMGANKNDEVHDWLRRQLVTSAIEKKYETYQGLAPFGGATTGAEFRYLCHLKGKYNYVLPDNHLANCLPRIFDNAGYPAVGAHGFSAGMFNRKAWWKQIGFTERLFARDFKKMDAPMCGSGFYGICDEFVIAHLGQMMESEPGFYYHLTLNTHIPVVSTNIPDDLLQICGKNDISKQACELNAKIGEYLQRLAEVIDARSNAPFVFIAGDHAPPFTQKSSAKFSREKTPYFVLHPLTEKDL